jgi:hypothetical protein
LFCLATNLQTDEVSQADPSYTQLTITALDVLRRDGVAPLAVPNFARSTWQRAYGSDGSLLTRWASSLRNVPVPELGQEPAVENLATGESRPMSRDLVDKRTTFAWRREDGKVVAINEGIDDGDGVHKRWEIGVEADRYTDFLRQLGDRVVTPQRWTHDDLMPYIPCRNRTRDEMRAEVASLPPVGE